MKIRYFFFIALLNNWGQIVFDFFYKIKVTPEMKYQTVEKNQKCFEKNHVLLQAWFLFFWKPKNILWDWHKFTQSFSRARCKFLVEPVLTGSDSRIHRKKGHGWRIKRT